MYKRLNVKIQYVLVYHMLKVNFKIVNGIHNKFNLKELSK